MTGRACGTRLVARSGRSRAARADLRPATCPRLGAFELRRKGDQGVVAAATGDELDADGQTVARLVQREAERRLPGHVERH